MSTIAAVIGRILIALLFIVSGAMKLLNPAPAAEMLAGVGLPTAVTIPAALFEVVLGVALAIGMMTRLAAILLAGFTALTIFFFHNQFNDPAQIPMILLHVALVGGLLGVFAHSQIWWSYDALRRKRGAELAEHDADLRVARAEAHADGTRPATVVAPKRRWF
ncbi:MAG: DoxX family protein [Pseudomonadota bacterium]